MTVRNKALNEKAEAEAGRAGAGCRPRELCPAGGRRCTAAGEAGEALKESIERDEEILKLKVRIEKLQVKLRKEKQLNRQMEINAEIKSLRKELEAL